MSGICANPECGEHLDDGGVYILDKEQDAAVLVCGTCAVQLRGHYRYEPLYEYADQPQPKEGAP